MMKIIKTTFALVSILSAILLSGCKGKDKQATTEEPEILHEFDINEDFSFNAFNWFDDALILCSGDRSRRNAMTIGWGGIGTLWGRNNTVTVYVAEKRYTKEFMDRYEYFTVMAFSDKEVLRYMGRNSGRDGDKGAALGLHLAYTENGTPYYEEADLVLECRTMYSQEFDPGHFRSDIPRRMYENFPAGLHSMYIGEVVKAMKK